MTQKEKQIKLLEARGWKKEYIDGNGIDDEVWIHPSTNKCWIADIAPLPDHFSDLNACHELEHNMSDSDYREYCNLLDKDCVDERGFGYPNWSRSAPPSVRAERIGQVLKLW